MTINYHFETHDVICNKLTYASREQNVEGFCVTPKHQEPLGLVICNRGGTGKFGRPDETIVFQLLAPFANAGFIAVTTCLGKPDQHGGADLEDSAVLLEEATKVYPQLPLFFFGFSRGATTNNQLLAMHDGPKPRAIVSSSGFADYAVAAEERPDLKELLEKLIGKWDEEEISKRSGVQLAAHFQKNIPFLLMHGSLDERVKPHHSLDMRRVLEANGNHVVFVSFDDCSHGYIQTNGASRWPEMLQLAIKFFQGSL